MPAEIIDGKALAATIQADVAKRVSDFKKQHGIQPGLAVILAGNNAASEIYVEKKEQACHETGILSEKFVFGEDASEQELIEKISELNSDRKIHCILVQLPLPQGINARRVLREVLPEKDVDGFTPRNIGALLSGDETFAPCTPKGIIRLIESTETRIEGANAVVVGASIIVGKPTAAMLLNRNATVTVCHKKTSSLAEHTKNADILVSAAGVRGLITASKVKQGAVVIDAGIVRENNSIYGDVDFENVKRKAGFITPVPGGVGPMTVACLMENTVAAAERIVGLGLAAEGAEKINVNRLVRY